MMFKIIDPDVIAVRRPQVLADWRAAEPFPVAVIDQFADPERLREIAEAFPDPAALNKSRDLVFARNKFEKNVFASLSPGMADLHADLLSPEFGALLSEMVGHSVFVDPAFHGGGLHMGGRGSYLDMHADFNVHPEHPAWLRELNVLLYLNHGWDAAWGGSLKLRHAQTDAYREIEPRFNRCVIMLTKAHTLHGYDPIAFPEGRSRQSIATYAYSHIAEGTHVPPVSTVWRSEQSGFRRLIGPHVTHLVQLKNRVLGSGSSRNR